MNEALFFEPIYQERVWGGRGLEEKLGRSLPEEKVIGESWEIVDRPEAQSVVAKGLHQGKTLREMLEKFSLEIMGPEYEAETPFPILVKWLDCQQRLSLQVHPPASVADELKGEPKTENWYVAEAEAEASLIVGLKNGVTREEFEEALREERLEPLVHRFPVSAGNSILVESGRLHAIDGGNLILEIQQNSDTTYRVYDWGRVGLDGKPRTLHIEESLKSIDFQDFEPEPLAPSNASRVLADCREFCLREFSLEEGESLHFSAGEAPKIISLVRGKADLNDESLPLASNALLPYGGEFVLTAKSSCVVLLTDRF